MSRAVKTVCKDVGRPVHIPTPDLALKSWSLAGCVFVLLAVLAVRFAEPILDGDLFWHMAYAKQMLARHTLIPDHTAFSWTPTSNGTIYCAWASELFFYWLWQHLGQASVFVFRYLCVLAVLALAWNYARQLGSARTPLTYLVLMILMLASTVGAIIKPEIFSLVFFNVLVWLFFQAKFEARIRWLYAAPVLMLIWVNTHGAFILAAPFLAATAVGETLNRGFDRYVRHLLTAWALCGVAVLLTPYGIHYPWQLFQDHVLGHIPRAAITWNAAYQSIFAGTAPGFHFIDFLLLMAEIVALVAVVARRRDWSVLLANVVYIPLFMVYLRTTFFWPAVFAYSVLYLWHLSAKRKTKIPYARIWQAAAAAVFLFLGGRACLDSWRNPPYASWLGSGISYINPVPEAEFLASAHLGPRLYNLFDSGGYLLWRLSPQYRVMVDSRAFPYLAWFDDQYHFSEGDTFDDFLRRYPADVASIDLTHERTWRHFLASNQWRPVFYGPTAVVFVKKDANYSGQLTSATGDLRNAFTAFHVFDFAAVIGDHRNAWAVLDQIETRLIHQASDEDLAEARAYREGHRALRAGDWPRAKSMFDTAFRTKQEGDRDRQIRILLANIDSLRAQGKEAETAALQSQLRMLAAPE